ncbi:hypothetical protein [Stutzerimonas stutzeri]|uniref:hypothetical protein n=1 Tax=Stutzerimonas stutzeri TaxID=316 RepID=UPI00210A17B6|nr:hypothetical protein [Stutzerimonas stutzeri]MCQ4322743.1 hypothetical protein [Stutzerimonas stutzeri]
MSLFDLLVSARKGSLTTAITIALLIGLILQIDGLIPDPRYSFSADAVEARSASPYATPD